MLVVLERGKRRLNSHSCQQAMFSSFTVRQKLVHLGTTVPRVFLFILCLTKQEGGRSSMPVEVSCTEGGGSNWQGGGVAIEPSQRIFAVSTTPTVHVMLSQPSSMICSSPTLKKSAWIHLCACRMLPIIFRKKKKFFFVTTGSLQVNPIVDFGWVLSSSTWHPNAFFKIDFQPPWQNWKPSRTVLRKMGGAELNWRIGPQVNPVVARIVKPIVIYGNHSVARDHKQRIMIYSKVIKLLASLSCKLKINWRS